MVLRCRAVRYRLSVHGMVVSSPLGTNSLDVATTGLFKYSMCLASALHVESEGLRALEQCVNPSYFQEVCECCLVLQVLYQASASVM